MLAIVLRLGTLLLSVGILLVGHGLHLSLLPLRAETLGWSEPQIGLSSSIYFTGLLLGCFSVPSLVRAVGHIRGFTVLTAVMTAALLGILLTQWPVAWFVLRLSIGVSVAGLYLIIESWLNEQVENRQRGLIISLYTMTSLFALAGGQLLLNVAAPDRHEAVVIAASFIVLAAVPVGLTRISQPSPIPTARFSPLHVFRTSRIAAVCSFVAGVVTGCYYGLGPVYATRIGLDLTGVSVMMASGIVGGAMFLVPLGRLSDRVDRRRVLLVTMSSAIAVCLVTLWTPIAYRSFLVFFFGASVMPIYALSLAHAADAVKGSFLEVGTGLLVVNSVGAIIGPGLAALLMGSWGPEMFFIFCGSALAAGAAVIFVLTRRQAALRPYFSPFEAASSASAQGAIELDPRSTEAGETETAGD